MRIIEVTLLADESVQVTQPKVYMGEHQAAELAITLPPRLSAGFAYYTLLFDMMDSGRQACTANIYPGEPPTDAEESGTCAWLTDGVLHCTLPRTLTTGSWLRCQVAASVQAEGACVRVEKSAPFLIAFEGGGQEGAEQLTPYTFGEVERLLAELDSIKNNLSVDWEAMSGALSSIIEGSMAGALAGCGAGSLTVEANGQILSLTPGVFWRLQFAPGVQQVEIVLDDSDVPADFVPEFRLRVIPPAGGAPALYLHYIGGQPVQLPDHFLFRAGRYYEFNILDRLALASSWEVAA